MNLKKSVCILLSMLMLASFMPFSAEAEINELVAYTDFETDADFAGWSLRGGTGGTAAIEQDSEMGNVVVLTQDSSAKQTFFCIKFAGTTNFGNMIKANSRIVGKAQLTLYDGSTADDMVEMCISNYDGDRLRLARIAGNNKVSVNRSLKNTSGGTAVTNQKVAYENYSNGDWVQIIYLIDVDESGNAALTYFVDGEKYELADNKTPFKLDNILSCAAQTPSFAVRSASAGRVTRAGFDNFGLYVTDEITAFTAQAEKSSDLMTDESIVIDFSTEIYKSALSGNVSVDGEAVSDDRITVLPNQKSISVAAPSGGYPSGSVHKISFGSAEDIFGKEISGDEITFSIAGEDSFRVTSFNGGKTSGIEFNSDIYVDFSENISADMFDGRIKLSVDGGSQRILAADEYKVSEEQPSRLVLSPGIMENAAYTLSFENVVSSGGQMLEAEEYSFSGFVFEISEMTLSAANMPSENGFATVVFTSPISRDMLAENIYLNGEAIDSSYITEIDEYTVKIAMPTLTEGESYTLSVSGNIRNANKTTVKSGREISFTCRNTEKLDVTADYSKLSPGQALPSTAQNTFIGNLKTADGGDEGTVAVMGAATSGDVYNILTPGFALSEASVPFVYSTRLKFSGGTGQLRLRLQQTAAQNSPSNNVLYFRNNKFSLRERNYGSGTDMNKIIEVGAYRDDVWYDLTVYFDITAKTPYMNVFLYSDDGLESYAQYNVDISPSMLALGSNAWDAMKCIGLYMQSGSSNSMAVSLPYQSVTAYSDNEAVPSVENGAQTETDTEISYSFSSPVTKESVNVNISENGAPVTDFSWKLVRGRELEIKPSAGEWNAGSAYGISGSVKSPGGSTVMLKNVSFAVKKPEIWAYNADITVDSPSEFSFLADNNTSDDIDVTCAAIIYESIGGKLRECESFYTDAVISAGQAAQPVKLSFNTDDKYIGNAQGKYIIRGFVYAKDALRLIMAEPAEFELSSAEGTTGGETVEITGVTSGRKSRKAVTLYVAAPGTKLSETEAPKLDSSGTVYSNTVLTGSGGAYDLSFIMNDENYSGEYPYAVVDCDGNITTGEFTFVNKKMQKEFIGLINKSESEDALLETARANIGKAGITNRLFESVGIEGIYKYLYANIPYNADDAAEFLNRVDEAVILAACNKSLPQAIKNGKLEYLSIIGQTDEQPSDKYISIYENELSEKGIGNVNSAMLGKGFASIAAARLNFKTSVLLNQIGANKAIGYSHVTDILKSNAGFFGIDISKYTQSRQSAVNKYLVQHPSSTAEELVLSYNAAIKAASSSESSSGGGGGSKGGGGGYVASSQAEPVSVPQAQTEKPMFSDLSDAQWAAASVNALAKAGIVSGYDGKFNPSANITREEFVKLITAALNIGTAGTGKTEFIDVDSSAWYLPYISAAVKNGLITGITADLFGTGNYITREDLAVIASRALKMKNISASAENVQQFSDNALISGYASESVYALKSLGILNGQPDGSFCPQGKTTRAEAAVVIYRIYGMIQ